MVIQGKPGKFIHIIGDAHAYDCHLDAINEQLKRIPSQFPTFKINREVKSIDDFKLEDFEIEMHLNILDKRDQAQ